MADIRVKDLTEATVPGADYYLLTDSATDGVKKVQTKNIVKPADIGAVSLKEPVIITGATGTATTGASSVAVQRTAPSATNIQLPSVASQGSQPIHIFDWSTSVTDHAITLTPSGTETIMLAASWVVYSNAAQLGSITLYPSTSLQGWYIAP